MTQGRSGGGRAAALVVFLALAGGPVSLSVAQGPTPPRPEGQPGFLRCPECGLEIAGADQGKEVLCPRCGQKKVPMQFSTSGRASEGGPPTSGQFPLVMAGIAVALAGTVVILNRVRAAREAREREREQQRERPKDDEQQQEVARYQEALRKRAERGSPRRRTQP